MERRDFLKSISLVPFLPYIESRRKDVLVTDFKIYQEFEYDGVSINGNLFKFEELKQSDSSITISTFPGHYFNDGIYLFGYELNGYITIKNKRYVFKHYRNEIATKIILRSHFHEIPHP